MLFIAIKTEDGSSKGERSFYCRMLEVSRQGFYKYLANKDRPWKYQRLADAIREILAEDECNDTYGRIRMYQALLLKRTVYRVMEEMGIRHRPKRRVCSANDGLPPMISGAEPHMLSKRALFMLWRKWYLEMAFCGKLRSHTVSHGQKRAPPEAAQMYLTLLEISCILLLVTTWSLIIYQDSDHVVIKWGIEMPAKLFFELDKEKRTNIISVGLLEFAQYGYTNSSTNRIVKAAGISKGSLFKYFHSKEDLYFYILDCVTGELQLSLKEKEAILPRDIFDRAIKYSELEFAWYIQNPEKYKMILDALTNDDTEIYHKTAMRYASMEENIYYALLENIDTEQLKWDSQKTIDILKWFLKGFNAHFISNTQTDTIEIDEIKKEYVRSLTEQIDMLKAGLAK